MRVGDITTIHRVSCFVGEQLNQVGQFQNGQIPMRKILAGIALLIVFVSVSRATTYYVSQAGGTFSGGSACNGQTAHAYSWLNGSGNYTSGDTVYLCGTITSELEMANSGTSASRINVIFDTGANITPSQGYCDWSPGCFNFGGQSYITLNGGTPCGWNTQTNSSEGVCNGYIQATANGSSLANQVDSNGVVVNGTGDEVKNLGIYNLYVYTAGSGTFPSGGNNVTAISCTSNAGCLVHDNRLHDGGWIGPIWSPTASTSGPFTVYNNEIYNYSHGPTLADGTSGATASGISIYGNYIHDQTWTYTGCPYHNDGIHLYGQSSASPIAVSATIYDNIFGGQGQACHNAQIFMEATTSIGSGNLYIYNNLLYYTDSVSGGTALMGLGPSSGGGGTGYIYDNTVVCYDTNFTGILLNYSTYVFENNLVKNCSPQLSSFNTAGTGLPPLTSNYNAFDTATCSSGPNYCFDIYNLDQYSTLAAWRSATSQDGNSQGGATDLSPSFVPQSGSSAVGAGSNLTNLNIVTLDVDLAGVARASNGTCKPGVAGCWDAGAYQSNAGDPPPQAPTALTAQVQ